jgi:rare lipoprotein A
MSRLLALIAAALLVAGCASVPTPRGGVSHGAPPASGKYYLDDGPGSNPPPDLDAIPDAVPRVESLHRAANRPYAVFGREYIPATTLKPYHERGIASWYGRKFHGQKTSIGEPYDMYAMTAAHPTLPLPSYARVTSIATGRSVVVRVNDRGPFLHDRIIDLSYAAAHRLGIAQAGSGEVDVEAILPGTLSQSARAAQAPLPPVADAPAITAPLAPPAEVLPTQVAVDAAPLAAMHGGYSVQLGAFASYANAQAFLARAQNQLATAQVEAKIRQAGGLYRVYIGPYEDRNDAERLGARITQAFGFPTTVAAH